MLEVMQYDFMERFKTMSDAELVEAFNKEVGISGWVSARAEYLIALHREFDERGIDYSAIGNEGGLSLSREVRLEGKKIIVVDKADPTL